MKISFVIPAYNEEEFIKECLESIYQEIVLSHADAEIIVVDNASTDNTQAVAKSVSGVKVVYEPKKGIAGARGAGFAASSGELVANIDADSKLPTGWITTVLEFFNNNPKLVCLSGPQVFYDQPAYKQFFVKLFYRLGFLSSMLVGSMVQGGNFVVKRDALIKAGGFNPEFQFYGEDTDIARRMAKVGKVIFTFKLPILASGRRLEKEGLLTIGSRYAVNYFHTFATGKAYTKSYLDIRNKK